MKENTRPRKLMIILDDDQVAEVSKAEPEITNAVETMIKKGKWSVPGYRVSQARSGPKEATFFRDSLRVEVCSLLEADQIRSRNAKQEKFGEFSLM